MHQARRWPGSNQRVMLTTDAVVAAAQNAGLVPNAIVIKRLDGTQNPGIHIDEDKYFYPASMLKTPLAIVAMTLVESGELRFDQLFEVTQSNMTANDQKSPFVPGYKGQLSQIIELMLTHSDNVATNMLYDILDRKRATEIAQTKYGLKNTAFQRKLSGSEPLIKDPQWDGIHRNAHSAGDAAKAFELIANDGVPYADRLREILSRQMFNEKLNKGLRAGDHFAHKTGDTDEVTHDGGLLEIENGPSYIIVVYTGLESSDQNNARFGPFMQAIRPLL